MSDHRLQLAVVIPVYNESECIVPVVQSWLDELAKLLSPSEFQLIVLNDGSKDDTSQKLEAFADHPSVEVVNKPNSGHGPTILLGYRKAVAKAEWVFQVDSDDEMKAADFHLVWTARENKDAVFGYRAGRQQEAARKWISAGSRTAVRLLFGGSRVRDVNTPYRLLKGSALAPIVAGIPSDTFAPNVLISGEFSRGDFKLENLPVPHHGRATGTVSIVKWRLVKAVIKAFVQTLEYANGAREEA